MKKSLVLTSFIILLFIFANIFFANPRAKADKIKSKIEFKGMNLVAPRKGLNDKTFEDLKLHGVNYISLSPYAFLNRENATISFNSERQWWGEKAEGIKVCIDQAHQQNMLVMLKPHLWLGHNFYTGNIEFATEADWTNWETDYEKYILTMAAIAQEKKIGLFCLGTELGKAVEKRPEYWFALIKKIRAIYAGKLTYAANWDDFERVPFWNQLDYIGIDAYFPLSEKETPSVEELKVAWKKPISKIEQLYKKVKKPILFTEFGYRNSNECAKEPWKEENNTENNQGQLNAYQALFDELSAKAWYKGGFAWKWYADDYHKSRKIDYTPQGKPVLEVIKRWYQ